MSGAITRPEFDQLIKRLDDHCKTQNDSLGKIWQKLDGIDSRLTEAQIMAMQRENGKLTRSQALIYSSLTLALGITVTVIGFLLVG
jgi:arsenate reductase-like glutaredoxin family protein